VEIEMDRKMHHPRIHAGGPPAARSLGFHLQELLSPGGGAEFPGQIRRPGFTWRGKRV
jgi:hypothetical protein